MYFLIADVRYALAAQFLVKYGIIIIVVVAAIITPLALRAFEFKQTTELTFLAPRDSNSVNAYTKLSSVFGAGTPCISTARHVLLLLLHCFLVNIRRHRASDLDSQHHLNTGDSWEI